MSRSKLFNISEEDYEEIIEAFPEGNPNFSHQDLEEVNKEDAHDWLGSDELVGLVSEEHGGIIGYIHNSHADEVAAALNLHVIHTQDEENGGE